MKLLAYAVRAPIKRSRWRDGLVVQTRVIAALMIRDAMARYGHENLGFFWVIGEPLMLTTGIMVLWSVTHMTHGSDIGVIPFALTGYCFITLWRHIVFRSINSMANSAGLAFHRQLRLLDVLIAKTLLETAAIFAAFMVAFLPLWLLGYCPGLQDPLALVGGFALSAWLSFGVGLILAALTEMSETAEHFVGPVMYITMPLTGCFFMVDWLPPDAQQFMLWSPLVNGVEMFRSGLFPPEFPTHWSATYLLCCCIGLTSIGLPLCRYAERHVEMP